MVKIHFLGAARLFVRLQIQRLDFIMVRPWADALSWACVREDLAVRQMLQASP